MLNKDLATVLSKGYNVMENAINVQQMASGMEQVYGYYAASH